MNVYCAGKTQDIATVRIVQGLVRATGHKITHDWTKIVEANGGDISEVEITEQNKIQYALWDMSGVYECDLLIAVGHPNLSGTLWECGGAAILAKPVWLVLWERYDRISIFESLPNVERVNFQELGERLWDISAKRVEMEPPPIFRVTKDGTVSPVTCEVPTCLNFARYRRGSHMTCHKHIAA